MKPRHVKILDLRGLKCPLPALRVRRLLADAEAATTYRVLATDPMSVIDIPHEVARAQAVLLSQSCEAGVFTFDMALST